MTESNKLWSRQFTTILLMALTLFLCVMLLTAGFPAHITSVTQDPRLGGLMTTFFMVASIITRPIIGFLLPKINFKLFNIIALLLLIVTIGFSYGEIAVEALLGLRILHGIAYAILSTCLATMATNIIPAKRLGEGIGFYGMATSGGTSFGPMIALALLHHFSYNILVAASVLLAVITLILNLTIKLEKKEKTADNTVKEEITFKEYAFDKNALLPCFIVMFFSSTLGGVTSFMKQLSSVAGVEESASLFFLVMAVVMIASKAIAGIIYDRMGHKIIIYPAALCGMIGLYLVSTTADTSTFLLAGFFYGITYGFLTPTLQTLAVSRAGKKKQGTANAMYFSSMDLGMALGAALLGILAKLYGYRFIYSFSILLLVILVVLYTVTLGRSRKETSPKIKPDANGIN